MEYKELSIKTQKESEEIDSRKLVNVETLNHLEFDSGKDYIEKRIGSKDNPFTGKAFYLPTTYDWVLGKDQEGQIILVPLRKLKE